MLQTPNNLIYLDSYKEITRRFPRKGRVFRVEAGLTGFRAPLLCCLCSLGLRWGFRCVLGVSVVWGFGIWVV